MNQYFHTGVFPAIPFEYSNLFFKRRNEFIAGQHITNLGTMGLIIERFINKVLRQTSKKRERKDIWIAFLSKHFEIWTFLVDLLLLYIFWGVYQPQKYHPPKYTVSIDIAVSLGMMARYMSEFSFAEASEWLEDNQNLMIITFCAYIYDQIDLNPLYYHILVQRFDHLQYNTKLKIALNILRERIADFIRPFGAANLTSAALQTPFILFQWKKLFKLMDSISYNWYIETKNPKYYPPCNIFFELRVMFRNYYCEQWNSERRRKKNENYAERKCFIPCDPQIHPWTTLLAAWTVLSGSKIPLFDLLACIGVPTSFIQCIESLPFTIMTYKSWKKTLLSNLHDRIAEHLHWIPYVMHYLDMCYKFAEYRFIPLSFESYKRQLIRVRSKACLPFSTPPESDILFCRFCGEVKSNYSFCNYLQPFTNLYSQSFPDLDISSQRGIVFRKNEFGYTKNNNVIVNENNEMTCGKKYIFNNVSERNYLCQRELLKGDLIGKVIRMPKNRWFAKCDICGSTALITKANYINGYIVCSNELRREPRVQFALANLNLAPWPHYFCNIERCNNVACKFKQILSPSFKFIYISLCTFHFDRAPFSVFLTLEFLNFLFTKNADRNPHYSSTKYSSKQSLILSYCKL